MFIKEPNFYFCFLKIFLLFPQHSSKFFKASFVFSFQEVHAIFFQVSNTVFHKLTPLTCSEMAGWLVTCAIRVPTMTCRWQSRASSQNSRAARHTEANRSQHRERLLLETSSH